MDTPAQHNPSRVREMDGLRGVLALWVLVAHICGWCGMYDMVPPFNLIHTWDALVSGAAPVEIFIILSGFAITYSLYQRKQGFLEFITGRFFRLYPVYLTCLLMAIGTSMLTPYILETASWRDTIYFTWLHAHYDAERANMAGHVLAHLTLLNGLIPSQILSDSNGTFLPPSWSITLEWQFYLVAPLLLLMVRSAKGIALLAVIAVLANHYGLSWQNPQMAFLPAQLPLFLAGIGSYHFYMWLKTKQDEGPKAAAMPIAIVLGAALLTLTNQSVALAGWALCLGCIFLRGDDLFSRMLGVIRAILLHPWLQATGTISYALYLIHWPLIVLLLHVGLTWYPGLTWAQAVFAMLFAGLPIILLGAIVLHRCVEVPGRKFGKWLSGHFLKRREEPAVDFPAFRVQGNPTS